MQGHGFIVAAGIRERDFSDGRRGAAGNFQRHLSAGIVVSIRQDRQVAVRALPRGLRKGMAVNLRLNVELSTSWAE